MENAMSNWNGSAFLEDLKRVVSDAGQIVQTASTKTRTIRHKGRIDLVTDTDVAVEEFLKRELSVLLPEADFLAEESAQNTRLGDYTWIIDPLDGTTNFAHGLPFVANSVALWHRDRVVLGIVNLPLMGELFSAQEGGGAWLNDSPVQVSSAAHLEESLLATGFPYDVESHLETILVHLRRLLPMTRGIRRPGAAALDLAYVACGRYDGFYESALNPWDTAAGWLLVKEAGGKVSEFDSSRSYSFRSSSILATNGIIQEALSQVLCRKD